MRYQYCPKCGAKLSLRRLGDDGEVPWCASCEMPWFDTFSTCVIALVTDGAGQVALLRQKYISNRYANLVSGYMQPGETAEEAAAREIGEELGLTTTELRFVSTYWFEKKDMLMIGFIARVSRGSFRKWMGRNGCPLRRLLRWYIRPGAFPMPWCRLFWKRKAD